jgi:hypothetical protein
MVWGGENSQSPGPDLLLYHGGSNGMNLAHIWIDRNRELAIVTATNISGPKADEGLLALARELYIHRPGRYRRS